MKTFRYLFIPIALMVGFLLGWVIKPDTGLQRQSHEVGSSKRVWTCSMHPQIRQKEQGKCPICGMDLVPQDASSSSSDPLVLEMTEEAVKLANIRTVRVGQAEESDGNTLRLNGTIEADETKIASLTAHISGRIEKLYISYTGAYVASGQKIALIYSPELITAQKELIEVQKLKEISPALLEAAKNKLRYWKVSEADIDQILSSGLVRKNFDIYADHGGFVTNRNVSVGDHVGSGEVLFHVVSLDKVWVVFDVYEQQLASIRLGSPVRFTTSSFPGQEFSARISFIDPTVDPATRVTSVRAEVVNRGYQLRPGMFVTGRISEASAKSASLSIPKSSVLWTGERSVVYVRVPNTEIPSYVYREVVLMEPVGNAYMVKEGVEAGEEVVVNGAFVIDAAAQLNNQASMMNELVGVKSTKDHPTLPDYTASTPEAFKIQLVRVVESYLQLKDALVESDKEMSSQKAAELLDGLSAVDMSLLDGKPHLYWMDREHAIRSHSESIQDGKDLEEQRGQFHFLSVSLIKAAQAFGVKGSAYYVQHCPMANSDKGADWISREQEVLNPYFGDRMLKCGYVTDTIN